MQPCHFATRRLALALVLFLLLLGISVPEVFATSDDPGAAEQVVETNGVSALTTTCPGPDGFGYRCEDVSVGYVSGVSDIGMHCSNCVTQIQLPFTFSFYGTSYNSAFVSAAGNLQFASNNPTYSNTALPNGDLGQAILPYWGNTWTTTGSGSGVFISTIGSAPNRTFIIDWRGFEQIGPNTWTVTYEVQLQESTNDIFFVYGPTGGSGSSKTAGIQGFQGGGSNFLQLSYNQPVLTSERAVRFTTQPPPTPTSTPTPGPSPTPTYTLTSTNTPVPILVPGQIYVVDVTTNSLVQVNPNDGSQTLLSEGMNLEDPAGVTTANDGFLYIADTGGGDLGKVIRAHPVNGVQTLVSYGTNLQTTHSITTGADGKIYVVDPNSGPTGGVFEINAETGAQTLISSGDKFVSPVGIAVENSQSLLVADAEAFGGSGGVIRISLSTGVQTQVSSGGNFVNPYGIAVASNGDIYVADADAAGGAGGVIRVNPANGSQTLISSIGFFSNPRGIAIGNNGDIYVVDSDAFAGSMKFPPLETVD